MTSERDVLHISRNCVQDECQLFVMFIQQPFKSLNSGTALKAFVSFDSETYFILKNAEKELLHSQKTDREAQGFHNI